MRRDRRGFTLIELLVAIAIAPQVRLGRELAVLRRPRRLVAAVEQSPGGVTVGFADGSVRFVKDSIDQQAWWGLGTRNGREIISFDAN